MKKFRKITGLVFGSLLILLLLFLLFAFVNHKIQSKREEKDFLPLGDIVSVNGRDMSIYVQGHGEHTLVFLSGAGTSSPILDFKALYAQLENEFRIVVIERFGYGFSDDTTSSRDVDSVLEESRAALQAAAIQGPFVLVPHSMAGLEALRWAQKYPSEVSAIVGLDMSTPEACEELSPSPFRLRLLHWATELGLTRLIPVRWFSDALDSGYLTDSEQDLLQSLFARRSMSQPMLNEASVIKLNAALISGERLPYVRCLLFSSNGEGTGFSGQAWTAMQAEFADEMFADHIELPCGHYLHHQEHSRIVSEIRNFLG